MGSGPAGFYTAHHLINKSQLPVKVDFFDRNAAPYGLSRYGVAPDHPEVKNCEEYMQNLLSNHPDRVRFFGNVNVGDDVSLHEMAKHYHSIVLAYGCTNSDKSLNIPGENLPGVISARQFVNWYNSHPFGATWTPPRLDKIRDVSIIGNGNVAIDVARVLLADPQQHWAPTDISTEAVELLSKSLVERINIVARRGLLESAFTNKEIRELADLSKTGKVRMVPILDEVMDPIRSQVKLLGRVEKRKVSILEKAMSSEQNQNTSLPAKEWSLLFGLSPAEFVADTAHEDLLSHTVFRKNKLIQDKLTDQVTAQHTDETVAISNQLVILSVGYEGVALAEFDEMDIAFDKRRNCLANRDGRLIEASSFGHDDSHNYTFKKGWYAAGWIKHGPKGVIATTMMESFDTADKILEDLNNSIHIENVLEEDLELGLAVEWTGWVKIDAEEIKDGKKLGKTRRKIQLNEAMVEVARG